MSTLDPVYMAEKESGPMQRTWWAAIRRRGQGIFYHLGLWGRISNNIYLAYVAIYESLGSNHLKSTKGDLLSDTKGKSPHSIRKRALN